MPRLSELRRSASRLTGAGSSVGRGRAAVESVRGDTAGAASTYASGTNPLTGRPFAPEGTDEGKYQRFMAYNAIRNAGGDVSTLGAEPHSALAPGQKLVGTLAPVAAGLIPGLGPVTAAALGAGGAAVRGGGRASLSDIALGAGTGLLARAATGGQGYKGLSGLARQAGLTDAAGKLNALKAAQLGLGAANVISGARQGSRADAAREAALGRVGAAPRGIGATGVSELFEDPTNPYRRGAASSGASRAAAQSLSGRAY